jgi:hypothetical protein
VIPSPLAYLGGVILLGGCLFLLFVIGGLL